MEKITPGIVLKQEDRGEADKLITLLTPNGVITAVMRGVKKTKAKLKFGALPFAFMEYTLSGKHGNYTVTGCTQIEDLSAVTANLEVYYCASFISEIAIKVVDSDNETFLELLKTIKAMLYENAHPLASAIHFCQFAIHNSGYGYDYRQPVSVTRPIELLYYTETLDRLVKYDFSDGQLLIQTLKAIAKNFEDKFDCVLLSKSFLI